MPRNTIPRPYPADLPGVTVEWLANANQCSPRSIRRWRSSLPSGNAATAEFLCGLTAEVARDMALLRPRGGILPYWSRMAIAEFSARGATYSQLMRQFRVSRSTIYRAIHQPTFAYCLRSGRRLLTDVQKATLRPE